MTLRDLSEAELTATPDEIAGALSRAIRDNDTKAQSIVCVGSGIPKKSAKEFQAIYRADARALRVLLATYEAHP